MSCVPRFTLNDAVYSFIYLKKNTEPLRKKEIYLCEVV